jgi:hypothetical protein
MPVQFEAEAPREAGSGAEPTPKNARAGTGGGPTVAEKLVAIAADAELFHAADGQAFATVPNGHSETWAIASRGFRDWLVLRYYRATEKVPNAEAVGAAINLFSGRARFDGACRDVFLRVGGDGTQAIVIDLCDEEWRAVEITGGGWRLTGEPSARFRRSRGMLPLPPPERGGTIDELRPFLNLGDEDDFRLAVAWIVAALRPRGPFPVLALQGEQGTAKSCTARVLRGLVDPSVTALRRKPRDDRDLAIGAENSWVLAFDNLSGLPTELSDAICCLATGGGFGTRTLFADREEELFAATRPVVLTGIDALATRGDLADRALVLTLPEITKRRTEAEFWRAYDLARPRILGALFDAISIALRRIEQIKIDPLPRMADFALWASAAGLAFGWEEDAFIRAYDRGRADAARRTVEADRVALTIQRFFERECGNWTGTASELLQALTRLAPETFTRDRGWPKTASLLSGRLRRVAPGLRHVGIVVTQGRDERGSRITLARGAAEFAVRSVSGVRDNETRGFSADDAPPATVSPDAADLFADDGDDGADGGFTSFSDADGREDGDS